MRKLVDNANYPRIADDYRHAFDVLNQLPCDVFLPAHTSILPGFVDKAAARRGATPNPFVDPGALRAFLRNSQQAFETTLAAQQKTLRRGSGQVSPR